jgi:hypothetical protein
MRKVPLRLRSSRDYGALSDVSKTLNYALGDRTGRSISMRTAQGFKSAFDINDMHEDVAEDIVHAGMLTTGALLRSESKGANACGLLLLLGLVACYQNG